MTLIENIDTQLVNQLNSSEYGLLRDCVLLVNYQKDLTQLGFVSGISEKEPPGLDIGSIVYSIRNGWLALERLKWCKGLIGDNH